MKWLLFLLLLAGCQPTITQVEAEPADAATIEVPACLGNLLDQDYQAGFPDCFRDAGVQPDLLPPPACLGNRNFELEQEGYPDCHRDGGAE